MNWMFLAQFSGENPNGVPFPVPTPGSGSTVTNAGGPVAEQTISGAQKAGSWAASGLDGVWDSLIGPNSPYFAGLIDGLTPIVALGFMFWSGMWAKDMIHDRYSLIPMQKVVWPVLVILLFANNGALLGTTEFAMKEMIYSLNDGVLNRTIDGIKSKTHIQNAQWLLAYENHMQEQLKACDGKQGESLTQCQEAAASKAAEAAKVATNNQSGVPSVTWNPLSLVRFQAKLAITAVVVGAMIASSTFFHWMFSFSLACWALTGPLWVGLTLLPVSTKGIYTFVSGFYGIGLMIVAFSMIMTAASVSLAQAAGGDPLLFPLVIGVGAPVLAFLIGAGSAVGLFIGLSRIASWVLSRR